jgi:hypothetical protein
MRPIARIAKASLKGTGEFPTLSVASSRLRHSDFASAAQALADAAAKHEKTFTDGGMPVDFLGPMLGRPAFTRVMRCVARAASHSARLGRN